MNEMRKLMKAAAGLYEGQSDWELANQAEHPVESQWHYDSMLKYGYKPLTDKAKGLVRNYRYQHPETGHEIILTTGMSSDRWQDTQTGEEGYWGTLVPHLQSLQKGVLSGESGLRIDLEQSPRGTR